MDLHRPVRGSTRCSIDASARTSHARIRWAIPGTSYRDRAHPNLHPATRCILVTRQFVCHPHPTTLLTTPAGCGCAGHCISCSSCRPKRCVPRWICLYWLGWWPTPGRRPTLSTARAEPHVGLGSGVGLLPAQGALSTPASSLWLRRPVPATVSYVRPFIQPGELPKAIHPPCTAGLTGRARGAHIQARKYVPDQLHMVEAFG